MLMIDKVDWSSGWPVVNRGTPSNSPMAAPVFSAASGATIVA